MPHLPVRIDVGTLGTAWLGDLEVPDFDRTTVEDALPSFLRRVADGARGIGLDEHDDR